MTKINLLNSSKTGFRCGGKWGDISISLDIIRQFSLFADSVFMNSLMYMLNYMS